MEIIRSKWFRNIAAALLLLGIAATTLPRQDLAVESQQVTGATIGDVLRYQGNFTILLQALEAANLSSAIESPGNLTLFAPTDNAFNALPAGTLEALLADPTALYNALTLHVVPGKYDLYALTTNTALTTQSGQPLFLNMKDGVLLVNNGQLIQANLEAANGIVHTVNVVLTPSAPAAPEPAPVAAPQPAPSGATYTVQPGEWLWKIARRFGMSLEELLAINPALQDNPNFVRNGQVLNVSGVPASAAPIINDPDQAQNMQGAVPSNASITQLLAGNANFDTLTTALRVADLQDVMAGPGPLTIFAPTDDAFAKLPPETLEALLANPDQLRRVLQYHVVAGNLSSGEIAQAGTLPTASGPLSVSLQNNLLQLNGATVIDADVFAGNGRIHVIDTVLVP